MRPMYRPLICMSLLTCALNAEDPWRLTFGAWGDVGSTAWETKVSYLADPISRLEYTTVGAGFYGDAQWQISPKWALEFGGRVGGAVSGTLNDQDWVHGQLLISDTESDIELGSPMLRGYARVRWDIQPDEGEGRLSVHAGLNASYERLHAEGIVWNNPVSYSLNFGTFLPDGIGLSPIGERFQNTRVISNTLGWIGPSLGGSLAVPLGENITLEGSANWTPIAYLYMIDTHHVRDDYIDGRDLVLDAAATSIELTVDFRWQISDILDLHFGADFLGVGTYSDAVNVVESPISINGIIDGIEARRDPFVRAYMDLTRQTFGPITQRRGGLRAGMSWNF